MKKKLRPLGDITSELEPLYFEMLEKHKMQPHEIIGLFLQWQQTHYPSATEVYSDDGSNPVWSYYGHQDGLVIKTIKDLEPTTVKTILGSHKEFSDLIEEDYRKLKNKSSAW